eukprot:4275486-Heterocapsa_arctica.AAC.1
MRRLVATLEQLRQRLIRVTGRAEDCRAHHLTLTSRLHYILASLLSLESAQTATPSCADACGGNALVRFGRK